MKLPICQLCGKQTFYSVTKDRWDCKHGCGYETLEPNFNLAPSFPATRMVDEFGFPLPKKEEISAEDLELTKRFLQKLKDETQSRGVFKVLTDLLGRLP